MPKFNVDVNLNVHFDAYCAKCGKAMCSNCDTDIPSKSGFKMRIYPCQFCIDKTYKLGMKAAKYVMTKKKTSGGKP